MSIDLKQAVSEFADVENRILIQRCKELEKEQNKFLKAYAIVNEPIFERLDLLWDRCEWLEKEIEKLKVVR
jgi:hypothetical protein